jgi:prolycopene isomerase
MPTYPSVVLYSVVDREVIPDGTAPIEMLIGNPDKLDESEVTVYTLSIDDKTLCAEDEHTVLAIGPTFESWESVSPAEYKNKKQKEQERLIAVLEKRFSGFAKAVRYAEVATPHTIERYTLKNGGAVAGPKQMLGQHMFKRQHIRTDWDNLFCCGESTVMGTGTPTVTTSGLSAANALLKKLGLQPFVYQESMQNYVRIVDKPFTSDKLFEGSNASDAAVMRGAMRCRFCEVPSCTRAAPTDIRGIMRRTAVGNFVGARKAWAKAPVNSAALLKYENNCICSAEEGQAVEIGKIVTFLNAESH